MGGEGKGRGRGGEGKGKGEGRGKGRGRGGRGGEREREGGGEGRSKKGIHCCQQPCTVSGCGPIAPPTSSGMEKDPIKDHSLMEW